MDKKRQNTYPKGHFPVRISIDASKAKGDAIGLLRTFIQKAAEKYPLALVEEASGDTTQAQAVISVPFPHREDIRIDFNIFASEMEEKDGLGLYFHMESAFE